MTNLVLESSAFSNGEEIPKKYGYKNGNVSPPLMMCGMCMAYYSFVRI